MSEDQTVAMTRDERGVVTLTMNRPEVRNAFDGRLVTELHAAAEELGGDEDVRVVVLTGAGDAFSAGADLSWMRSTRGFTYEDNVEDARRLAAMLRALYELPKPLVGRINGAALGGGGGLAAVCDIAITVEDAVFGFTEVTLGLAPAVIAPYVVRKVGRSFARSVFVTGERVSAERAREAGLVHEVLRDPTELDAAVDAAVGRCLRAGPVAAGVAKTLPDLVLAPLDEATDATVDLIARLRVSEEGQEGMAAFFDRRAPRWARKS